MALHLPAHTLSDEPTSNITRLALNSTDAHFGAATTDGWAIYTTNPLETVIRRDLPDASLRLVLPLERSNLLFLVGGPPSPLYPPNKVIMWDCQTEQAAAELEFREEVRGLAARRDRLVVVLRRRVVLFVLGRGEIGIWREGTWETSDNPKGLVALATEPGSSLLAFPGRQPGQVQLVRLPPHDPSSPPLPPPPSHDPTMAPYPSFSIILAHESSLSALSCTPSGSLLATASSKGTLVRVWDANASSLVKELRRGTDTAEIFDIAMRQDGGAVAVSSDKGTVHVWDLKREKDEKRRDGRDSGSSAPRGTKQLSLLKPYLPKYFSSSWSHSQFRLPSFAPPSSRLPFTQQTPGPMPPNPLASSGSSTAGPAPPTNVEDDVCICCWVNVEVEVYEDASVPSRSGTATPTASSAGRYSATALSSAGRGRVSSFSSSTSTSTPASTRRSSPSSYSPTATTFPAPPSAYSRTTSSRPISPVGALPPIVRAKPLPQRIRKEKEWQLVALTHSGGWFRIAFDPNAVSSSPTTTVDDKGKGKEREVPSRHEKDEVVGLGRDSTSDCRLVEYRKFGRREEW
ncbi:hypothetical protein JCM11641_007907 [Rhodosporidiobolus odoratus]